ncbi:ABC transporter permease [Nonomuraea sp. NPDC050536]|uniref:ABC transporter permease n=1 Tax=Nonomuraea sp. NPDC050536 TaxID=3364366 RepID=UPI0037C66EDC
MTDVRVMLLILAKDLRQRVRDRSLFMLALVVPFGLAAIFSLVFHGLDERHPARIALADQDRGPVAASFSRQALRPLERGGAITLVTAADPGQARALVERGEVDAAYVLPAGLSQAVLSARPASIQVIGDVDAQVGSYVARSVAGAFAAQVRYVQVALAAKGSGDPQSALATPDPLTVRDAPAGRRQLTAAESLSAGMAVFFLFFTVQFGFSGILDERRDGTLVRLLAAPVPRYTIVFGKLLSGFVLGVASMAVLLTASALLLGAHWGDPVGVGLLIVSGVLAATGVMATVATAATSAEQAGNIEAVVAVLLGVLGGVFLPTPQLSDVMAGLSLVTPHRWFLQGLADLSGGGGPGVVAVPVLVLTGIGVVTIGLALLRVGRWTRA